MLFKSTDKLFYNHVRKIMSVSDINLLHLCNKKDVQLVSCKKYSKPNYLKNKTWLWGQYASLRGLEIPS